MTMFFNLFDPDQLNKSKGLKAERYNEIAASVDAWEQKGSFGVLFVKFDTFTIEVETSVEGYKFVGYVEDSYDSLPELALRVSFLNMISKKSSWVINMHILRIEHWSSAPSLPFCQIPSRVIIMPQIAKIHQSIIRCFGAILGTDQPVGYEQFLRAREAVTQKINIEVEDIIKNNSGFVGNLTLENRREVFSNLREEVTLEFKVKEKFLHAIFKNELDQNRCKKIARLLNAENDLSARLREFRDHKAHAHHIHMQLEAEHDWEKMTYKNSHSYDDAFDAHDSEPTENRLTDKTMEGHIDSYEAESDDMTDGHEEDKDSSPSVAKPNIVKSENNYDLTGKTPRDIERSISATVQGQTEAVRAVSLTLFQHISGSGRHGCLLLSGPTGTGKTLLCSTAARISGLPFITVNTATLTPEGIHGQTLSDVFSSIIEQGNGIKEKYQKAIILFDEIDKLSLHSQAKSITGYETTILNQILKCLEGCVQSVTHRGHNSKYSNITTIDTSSMLIFLAGAWTDARLNTCNENPIGFTTNWTSKDNIKPKFDLGMPLEIMGRISQTVELAPHTADSLVAILRTAKESPIIDLMKYLETLGSRLLVNEYFLVNTAKRALELKYGARGLWSLVKVATDKVYWLDNKSNTTILIDDLGNICTKNN